MTLPPFPLAWPEGLPRTSKKAASQFRTSLSAAQVTVSGSKDPFALRRAAKEVLAHVCLPVGRAAA